MSQPTGNIVTLSLDHKGYNHKPDQRIEYGKVSEVVAISGRIAEQVTEIDAYQLASAAGSGRTFCPTIFSVCPQRGIRRRQEQLFESSQVIALDLDQGLPQAFPKPTLMYTSFSHTEAKPKYRLVWFLSEPVMELAHYKALVKGWGITVGLADPACKDAARLFFGSTPDSILQVNPEVILDVRAIRLPKVKTQSKPTTWADGETEAEQRDILFKLKPVHRRWLVSFVSSELDKLKTFDGADGSRYRQLWSTTANLACTPELIPDVVASWVAKAVETNSYYTVRYDKEYRVIIESAVEWAKNKRC